MRNWSIVRLLAPASECRRGVDADAERIHGKAAQRARRVDVVDHALRLHFDDRIRAGAQAGELVEAVGVGRDANRIGRGRRRSDRAAPGRPRSDRPMTPWRSSSTTPASGVSSGVRMPSRMRGNLLRRERVVFGDRSARRR